MSRITDRQLARRLRPDTVPEPPAGLLEELRRQIPAEIQAPAPPGGGHLLVFRRPLPRRLWLAAASLATLVGGGTLSWLALRHQLGVEAVPEPKPQQQALYAPTSPAEAPGGSAETRQPRDRRALGNAGMAPAAAAPSPIPAFPGLWSRERQAQPVPRGIAAPEVASAPAPALRLAGVEEGRAGTVSNAPSGMAGGARGEEAQLQAPTTAPRANRIAAKEEVVTAAESPLPDARRIASGVAAMPTDADRSSTTRDQVARDQVAATPAERADGAAAAKVRELGYVSAPAPAVPRAPAEPSSAAATLPPSTGGTAEPNDQPYGDVFFHSYGVNPFVDSEDDALSTFALDVDTGAYNVVRRYLDDGNLPPAAAVRVEELVNAFDYGDAPPRQGDFALTAEGAPDPWAPGDRYVLARFAIKAREVQRAERRPADLVFVVDVSGSMAAENRLELVKRSLRLLLGELTASDRVGLVVFGSQARVLLPLTADVQQVAAAIERLAPEGATNTEQGLAVAFDLVSRLGRRGAIHRVILCSDGVANVGNTGPESILASVGAAARRGVELTTVGFGMGNYNDELMEQLADRGNGRYAYVDEIDEARRTFVESLTGTLETVAAEARAQVEVDPRFVSRWRLLGYENRDVADTRFRDDSLDAGEVGAGHTVSALYELKLRREVPHGATLAVLRLRWRPAAGGAFVEQQQPLRWVDLASRWEAASRGFRLATVVGRFAEMLRGSYWARQGPAGDEDLGELARRAAQLSEDWPRQPRVEELVRLISRARDLRRQAEPERPPGRR